MKRLVLILTAALLALQLQAPASAAAAMPADPGPWRPSTIGGCFKSTLERHVERRTTSYRSVGGQLVRYVEFRHVATVLRWCPSSSYELVTWRGAWGPARR